MAGHHKSMFEIDDEHFDCYSYFANEPATSAWVFIHGFGGSPGADVASDRSYRRSKRGTWAGFSDIINREERFRNCDAFFIGYSSVLGGTYANAHLMLPFLTSTLCVENVRDLVGYRGGDIKSYESVTLVAHSEGGVVARKMVLHAHRNQVRERSDSGSEAHVAQLIAKADLFLFAPAQGGHRMGGVADAVVDSTTGLISKVPVVGGWLSGATKLADPDVWSPAFQDMDPGSLGLAALKDDSEAIRARTGPVKIRWAQNDVVVQAVDYRGDQSDVAPGETHSSVCKPDSEHARAEILRFLDMA